jgi:hypothetical protein
MLNEPTLDHCNQIAVVISHNEPNWATTPGLHPLEFGKVLSMILVGSIKGHIRSTVEL